MNTDETRYAIDGVIKRLRKVNARPTVARDAVASDNLRLAIKALRRIQETAPREEDKEPIDIFNI